MCIRTQVRAAIAVALMSAAPGSALLAQREMFWIAPLTAMVPGSPAGGFSRLYLSNDGLLVQGQFAGLLSLTTTAEVRCCTANPFQGVASAALILDASRGFPAGVPAELFASFFNLANPGSYTPGFLAAHGGTAAGAFEALINGFNAGLAQVVIQTTGAPGGEIGGTVLALVPEPAPGLLFVGGVAVIGLATLRRRQRR